MSTPYPSQSSPLADLSYRNYDGPLEPPAYRWWVIAKMSIRQTFKKKSFWVLTSLSGLYYIGMLFVLFVVTQIGSNTPSRPGIPDPGATFLARVVWKDQFVHGFSMGQIWYLVIVLLLGAGAIANDNRANALLVYLSKPCTKLDYLMGKWVGLFIPLVMAMGIPSLVFFVYGALSYRENGFLSNDPWMILKIAAMIILSSGFYASLILGFSSMFKQGRIAGATFAGLYFITNFFTQLMVVTWSGLTHPRAKEAPAGALETLKILYYGSIDGVNIGMAKAVLGTDSSPYFGIPSRARMVPAPPLALEVFIIVVLSAISLFIAWRRIRAVEVVG